MSRCIRIFNFIIAFQRLPNSFATESPQQPTFCQRCLLHGAPNLLPESRTAIALLIDAAAADLARRGGGSEAASKGNPKGNPDSF
jgi:hypothetical protein